jgi:hypothetical protein
MELQSIPTKAGMDAMISNNSAFNQDLSIWNVVNVTECSYFSNDTPQWTLPKPNFTNCTQ